MPTPTYTPLANITTTGATSTISFTGISQLYRDLVLVCTGKTNLGTCTAIIRPNNDSGTNAYSYVFASGNGSRTLSQTSSTQNAFMFGMGDSYINTTPGWNLVVHFMDYSATDKHKTVIAREGHQDLGTDMYAQRWSNTSAITSLVITGNGTYGTGTTFALFGVAA